MEENVDFVMFSFNTLSLDWVNRYIIMWGQSIIIIASHSPSMENISSGLSLVNSQNEKKRCFFVHWLAPPCTPSIERDYLEELAGLRWSLCITQFPTLQHFTVLCNESLKPYRQLQSALLDSFIMPRSQTY